jgi:hypothetical protein
MESVTKIDKQEIERQKAEREKAIKEQSIIQKHYGNTDIHPEERPV